MERLVELFEIIKLIAFINLNPLYQINGALSKQVSKSFFFLT